MLNHLIAGLLFVLPVADSGAPQSQMRCGDAASGLQQLHDRYGEDVVWTGQDDDGGRIIITAAKAGNWTLLVVPPGQDTDRPIACIVDERGGGEPS